MSSPEPARVEVPGSEFLTEIHEQPQALRALLEHESAYARVATAARERGATTVRMVGHGSSAGDSALPPSQGRCAEALRPACAIWMPNFAVPMRLQCATTRVNAASQSSE